MLSMLHAHKEHERIPQEQIRECVMAKTHPLVFMSWLEGEHRCSTYGGQVLNT